MGSVPYPLQIREVSLCPPLISKSPLTPLCQRGVAFPPLEKGDEGGFYVAIHMNLLVKGNMPPGANP